MNAVVESREQSTAIAAVTPMEMLQIAVQQGADLDRLQKLMDLQERWESNQARKAFVAAMAAFKSEPISILKTKQVNIPGGAKFAHATLADVVDGVCSALAKHGLSHKWETLQDATKGIVVTCILTHEAGHSERTTLAAMPDDSGKKNSIQQIASTVTYLERYTLMAACGLAAKDMDDDGRAAGKARRDAPPAPDGYDNWKADMKAVADEGSARLQESWKASSDEIRRYVIKSDDEWWQEIKAKSVQADRKATQS
jgi:hypothetical protein